MSFDLVLFGGTGDLAWRKLMPALFQAFRHSSLPQDGRIVGVARDDLSDDQYRELIQSRFSAVEGAKRPSPEEFKKFASMLYYLRMDLSKPDDYARLADLLKQRDAKTIVMYVATAPALFTQVVEQIAAAGLNGPRTRIVLEKPLGHDLASNRAINAAVGKVLEEKQVFRIDHYLGKPSVQNLFAMRFGNALFEPIWRREHIANIQITMAEDLGVEKRFGAERVGAYERLLLDVIDGRLNLFVRSDEQEEAWRWVEPLIDSWASDGGPRPYAAGTWGPSASSAMIARDGFSWGEEQ